MKGVLATEQDYRDCLARRCGWIRSRHPDGAARSGVAQPLPRAPCQDKRARSERMRRRQFTTRVLGQGSVRGTETIAARMRKHRRNTLHATLQDNDQAKRYGWRKSREQYRHGSKLLREIGTPEEGGNYGPRNNLLLENSGRKNQKARKTPSGRGVG